MIANEALAEQLRQLRESYASALPAKLALVEQAFRSHQDKDALRTLRHLAHGLAGSGTTFGYPELSEAARRLEITVNAALEAARRLSEAEIAATTELLETLCRAAQEPAVPMPTPIPSSAAASAVARKLIYLVEDDVALATDLALQLRHFGYQVRTFETPEWLYEAMADPALAVILMDIVFPQGELAGVEAIMELAAARFLKAPVVFMSVRGDLQARLAASRAGAAAYIMKPVEIGVLLNILDGLTSDQQPEPYRVLIVEDSEPLAQHYAHVLQSAGIRTDVVTDPMQILAHLANFKPDLVLMDMYLPGCTGMELAAVIRQLENYDMVPIVFLSSENDTGKQLTAMKLGGDDFLTKPIEPAHLISAVTTRLRRYRVMRSYIECDGLTGLLNHAALKGRLSTEISRAARQSEAFCLAMIDVDLFKEVNDNHGHLAGDRVLRTLAELLKRRLRRTDIIGRVGGDEFAVILPHTQIAAAVSLLESLKEAFSGVRHHADGREFASALSCGVVEFRRRESAEAVSARADQALYRAKESGRNRVMTGE
ncbi:diguanylate cyclase [Ramlibacter sp. 2FC]|uniref:diguanylate cyclase n=1 Tax=Ramlibacter sp. 2FC TaxID=2502188 RepID=UPI0010F4E6C6|nr:diguanylate cyclase [Ramlibacter sp. 2FC]